MSQSTDTTQPLPQADPEATVETPIMSLQQAAQQLAQHNPALPAVTPQPAFDPMRARLQHLHRVLGRLLHSPTLGAPDSVRLELYGNGLELLVRDEAALAPYAALFSGEQVAEDRENSLSPTGRSRYAAFVTVLDGVEVRAWTMTHIPAVEQPVAEPVAEASEPEPQHDTAPAPQPEAPAEHPEAA